MSVSFSTIRAVEILDSRGNPTLSVTAHLREGTVVYAGVPPAPPPAPARRWSCVITTQHDSVAAVFSGLSLTSTDRSPMR
ncbi:hypothetical protein GCM10020255_021620 [Rhodococcus baikonurensis]